MKFVCRDCGGNSFFLHMTPDNNTLAQCTKCGKATRFEKSAMTTANTPNGNSSQSSSTVREKLHLQLKS